MSLCRRLWIWVGSLLALAAVLTACVPLPARDELMPPTREGTAGTLSEEGAGQLVARRVTRGPELAGELDPMWAQAQSLRLPLSLGSGGTDRHGEVQLRALYTADDLYLLAHWLEAASEQPPPDAAQTTENKLTVHWRIVQEMGTPPACEVACHTAHTDGAGRLAYIHAETIPPGSQPALHAAGGWHDGAWTLVWSRPLINDNLYDLQFSDLDRPYPFFVKLFRGEEGRTDDVSALHELVFER